MLDGRCYVCVVMAPASRFEHTSYNFPYWKKKKMHMFALNTALGQASGLFYSHSTPELVWYTSEPFFQIYCAAESYDVDFTY